MRAGSPAHVLIGVLRAFVGAWLILALLSQATLSLQIPVTDGDLRDASWIVPYSTVMLPFRLKTVLVGLGLVLLMVTAGLWRRQRANAILVGLLGVSLLVAPSPAHMLRVGVANGTARIGCYVYAMQECREMLGLQVGDTQSRYALNAQGTAEDYASWYRLSFALLHPRQPKFADLVSTLPGGYFLLGPRHAFEGPAIKQALARQRDEVAALRRQIPALGTAGLSARP